MAGTYWPPISKRLGHGFAERHAGRTSRWPNITLKVYVHLFRIATQAAAINAALAILGHSVAKR
jgi:hypothetical protein